LCVVFSSAAHHNKKEIAMNYLSYYRIGNATLIVTHSPSGEEVEYQVQTAQGLRSCYFDRRDHAEAMARAC